MAPTWLKQANTTLIIRFVDLILSRDPDQRATFILSRRKRIQICHRGWRALRNAAPPALAASHLSAMMASMNIAERRPPQDGRIQKHRGTQYRSSSFAPLTQFGEPMFVC
jgi:type II secretory ATPase GspE/PulE/Tfp pilus assembly ATPase PilB-like protein